MKRIVFLTVVLVFGGFFFYRNLRGVWPAFFPPPQNISELLVENTPSQPLQPGPARNETDFPLVLPDGFSISIFAKDLGSPRVMTWDPSGNLLVSVPASGRVLALPDDNNDGRADRVVTVVDNLSKPHGLAFHPKTQELYVAEIDEVVSYAYDSSTFTVTSPRKVVDLPSGGNHTTRTIGFGPDGKLYIAVGSTCNVCIEKDWRRTKVLVADPDGGNFREFASGLRNAVFFTWHPMTHELWATEMGRDFLGDDLPPDEVNIVREGRSYGWPYCYGNKVHDRNFDASTKAQNFCRTSEPLFIDIPAHSAPLGLAFIPESSWPKDWNGDLLVAYHGSWNRNVPTGYKVVRMKFDQQGNYTDQVDFISGWLRDDGALGRPVDLLFGDAGTLFISDDKAGVIYGVKSQSSPE